MIYVIIGCAFPLFGILHFLLTVIRPVLKGDWQGWGVPVSRTSDVVWSIVIASWGAVWFLFPFSQLAAILLFGAAFPALATAARHDHYQWRKKHSSDGNPEWARPRLPVYFRNGRALCWFLVMLVPVFASGISHYVEVRRMGEAVILALIGAAAATAVLDVLFLKVSVSNWGVVRKDTRPVRYWLDLAIWATAYAGICLAGFLLRSG